MNVTVRGRTRHFRTVAFDAEKIPSCSSSSDCCRINSRSSAHKDFQETAAAIKDMIVRGAGAIGATAAYGLAQGARAFRGKDLKKFQRHVEVVYQTLKSARPTAVDPVNAMNDVRVSDERRRNRGGTTSAGAGGRGGICQ